MLKVLRTYRNHKTGYIQKYTLYIYIYSYCIYILVSNVAIAKNVLSKYQVMVVCSLRVDFFSKVGLETSGLDKAMFCCMFNSIFKGENALHSRTYQEDSY